MTSITIGVFALQGAVMPHKPHVEATGAHFKTVKTADDLSNVDALILPGGESTTMLKLIERFALWDALSEFFKTKPTWGICAGAILLAETVQNPAQKSFGALPITVGRNGYGRQLDSHQTNIQNYPVSFIRAPVITDIKKKDGVEIHATHNETPVWIQKEKTMATTFHPELTQNFPSPMHEHFVYMVRK